MKKSKKEYIDLSFQFEHPLNNIQSSFINSDLQAEQFLSDIERQIKNRDDWSVRSSGIQLALSCLKGGITKYLSIDYSSFAADLALCLTDLRSSLVKSGSLLVAASSQILQDRYITSIKIIIPALFKQLSHGTAVISESSRLALIEITKNVQNSKTYQTIIPKLQSKSCQQRLAIADVLFVVLDRWPNSKISPFTESINSALENLIEDPTQNVRKAARKAMLLFKSKCAKEDSFMQKSSKDFSSSAKSSKKRSNTGKDKRSSAFTLSMRNSLTKVSKIPKTPKIVETKLKPKTKQKKIRSCSPVKGSSHQVSSPNKKLNETKDHEQDIEKEPNKKSQPQQKNQSKNQSQAFQAKSAIPMKSSKNLAQQEKRTPVKQQKLYFVTPYPRNNQKVQFVDTSDNDDLHTPKEVKQFSFTLPAFQPKGILKPSNYPNIIRKSEIEYYMPPKSMNDAESFREALIDTIDTEMYEKFDGIEGLLCPSIITAVKFIPGIDEWDSVIPILLSQYPDDFRSNIHELIAAFRCDPWLISYSCDVFGSQHVAEKFAFSTLNMSEQKNNKYKLKFFCSLFEQKIPIQITLEMQLFLKKLIEQNQEYEDINYIEEAIDQDQDDQDDDVSQVISGIIQKIKLGFDCSDDGSNLDNLITQSPVVSSTVENILQDELPDIIQEGSDTQRYSAFSFIQNVPSLSFIFLVDSMIYLLLVSNADDNHEIIDKTRACLIILMKDRDVFNYILESLYSDEEEDDDDNQYRQQTTLSLLLNYFQECDDQVIVDLLPDTFNQLSPILESDITSLRRIVVLIFVEFKCKIPDAFELYADKIPTKHQKLIELYTSRRKVRST